LNCGTSLLVVIRMTAFKLQSVSIDLFFYLFIFRQEKACSQMYLEPNCDKSLAAKFFVSAKMTLQTKIHKTPAD